MYQVRRFITYIVALSVLLLTPNLTSIVSIESTQAQTSQERLAVLRLRNRINMSREEIEYLTGLVRRIASKRLALDYLIMTQENIEVLLPPNTNLEECVSECQVETGRTIGARFIITGEVLRFGKSLRLTLRMHDTKTGQLISSEVAKSKDIEGLESPTEKAVDLLITQIKKNIRPPTVATNKPSLLTPSKPKDQVIIVGTSHHLSTQTNPDYRVQKRRSRQQKLEERAQQAHADREARLQGQRQERQLQERQERKRQERQERKRQERQERQERKRQLQERKRQLQERKRQEIKSSWSPVHNELYLGLGTAKCELEGEKCGNFESDASLQMGWTYHQLKAKSTQRWHWQSGLDFKYAHNSFSTPSSIENYTLNTLTVGYVFGYNADRLNIQATIGWGLMYGTLSSESSELEFKNYNAFNLGLSVGFRLSPVWRLVLYTDTLDSLGESNACDFYSDVCAEVTLPKTTQTGLRISLTF